MLGSKDSNTATKRLDQALGYKVISCEYVKSIFTFKVPLEKIFMKQEIQIHS